MPVYDYQCEECSGVYEVLRPMADRAKPIECECGGKCVYKITVGEFTFKKRWIPTQQGWQRGDM